MKHKCWICNVEIDERFLKRVSEGWECLSDIQCARRILGNVNSFPEYQKRKRARQRETLARLRRKAR